MQIYEPKWQGVAGGREMGGSREREKESCSSSKYTATNLAAETPRLRETRWQQLCQVCVEQPLLPFASMTECTHGNWGDSPAGSINYICVLNIHRQEEPRGKEKKGNPWTVWNPNSLDNKTVSLKSSFKQVKAIHEELADSCFKINPYVLFAPHSGKAIITLELKIYQGLGISPNPLGSRNSPHHYSGKAKPLCSLLQPETDCPAALSYTPTPAQTQASPALAPCTAPH